MILWTLVVVAPNAAEPDLGVWSERVGVALAQPEAVRAEGDGVVLLMPGESLLLQPAASGDRQAALDAALGAQMVPFESLGIPMPTPNTVSCTVAGGPAACRQSRLELAPGAAMVVTAARADGADWSLVCLDRQPAAVGPCAALLQLTPAKPQP
jgi:hypothetical protein